MREYRELQLEDAPSRCQQHVDGWGMTSGAATYTLMLKQSGTRVTGTLTGAGTSDGPIEGIVDGNTIKLRDQGGPSETPALMVKGDVITGFVRGSTLTLRRVK
jgi:hypothetical protein